MTDGWQRTVVSVLSALGIGSAGLGGTALLKTDDTTAELRSLVEQIGRENALLQERLNGYDAINRAWYGRITELERLHRR